MSPNSLKQKVNRKLRVDFHKLIGIEEVPGTPIKYLDSQFPLAPVESKSLGGS